MNTQAPAATTEVKSRNQRVVTNASVDAETNTAEIVYTIVGQEEPTKFAFELSLLAPLQLLQAATVGLNTFITNSYSSAATSDEIKAAIDKAIVALLDPEKGYKSRLFRDPTTVGQRDETPISVIAYLRLLSKAYVLQGKAAITESQEVYADFAARWKALSDVKRKTISDSAAFQAEFKQIQIERATAKLETTEVAELSLDDLVDTEE